MGSVDLVVALVVGAIQGVVEWLPVSSEGVVALVLAGLEFSPSMAVRLALALHAGTALAAAVYYRTEIRDYLALLPAWRPGSAFEGSLASLTFLGVATGVSAVVGIAGYRLLLDAASEIGGGLFIALIGGLLVLTGVLQRAADTEAVTEPRRPTPVDAVLVGVGQGLAVLPGVSRSGTTVSLLLLRGYRGETAFELSFLLAIPASLGAGALTIGDGGLAGVGIPAMGLAFAASAVVGYVAIGALLDVVRRVAFWGVCVGFGGLAVIGGLGIALV